MSIQASSEKKTETQRNEILLVSPNNLFDDRLASVSKAFGYGYQKFATADAVAEGMSGGDVRFIILDTTLISHQNDIVGHIQVLKYVAPDSFVLVVFPKRFDKETLQWIRKSGANALMLESEFRELSRFDFFLSQIVGKEYVPVKHGDFKLDSKIDFPLFYFMSANRCYLSIVNGKTILDESRIEKIKKMGDVYIRRSDMANYQSYLQANEDQSAKGLLRRIRRQFHQFRISYLELLNHLTEQAEGVTYEDGKKRLEECQRLSNDLIVSMMSAGSVFDIISQAVEGDLNAIDRVPERVAMAGYFSMLGDIGDPDKVILAALLSDVGMLNLPYQFFYNLREKKSEKFDPQTQELFEQHPQLSLNCVAQKKIQLDPLVREAILYSHARLDEKGFPVVRPEKISIEAQIVHLAQQLDDACQIKWGHPRPLYREQLKKILSDPSTLGLVSHKVVDALKNFEG